MPYGISAEDDLPSASMYNKTKNEFTSRKNDDISNNYNKPQSFLIINNISKRANIRSLLLTAAAFGCETIFVAGQRKFNFDVNQEEDNKDIPMQLVHHIQSGKMKIIRFDKLPECVTFIRSQNIQIIGVEIDETSVDLEETEAMFRRGDTAFMMGNEGQGMNAKQMSLCDGFVRIAQYGGGTASLNVNVAASIVLHRFQIFSRTYHPSTLK